MKTQEKSEAARGAVTACVSGDLLQTENHAGGSAADGALILQHGGPCAAAGLRPRTRRIFATSKARRHEHDVAGPNVCSRRSGRLFLNLRQPPLFSSPRFPLFRDLCSLLLLLLLDFTRSVIGSPGMV